MRRRSKSGTNEEKIFNTNSVYRVNTCETDLDDMYKCRQIIYGTLNSLNSVLQHAKKKKKKKENLTTNQDIPPSNDNGMYIL